MQVTVSQEQARVPVTMLLIKGNIDSSTYEQFEASAKQAMQSGAKDLLIDLTDAPYMSSAGIRVLTSLFNQLHNAKEIQTAEKTVLSGNFKSPHLKLAGVPQRVLQVLKMAGIDEFLDIHKNRQDALAAF
jgi:anti-anti-sigma factor